jgi:hypothetical protein
MTDPRPRRRRERHDLFTLAGMALPTRRRVIGRRKRPTARPEASIAASTAKAAPAPSLSPDETKREPAKARWLWAQRQPIVDSPAERYLRACGYGGIIPSTVGFLPARDGHPPALIAALGMTTKPEPGVLAIDDAA